jgi:hypothetical protein
MKRIVLGALLALLIFSTQSAADCSSSSGCLDCADRANGGFICQWENASAFCSCEVFVFGGSAACGVDGSCQYNPGGGGGGGTGGGGGGGGGSCTQLPGRWCPAECTSCEPVYF